MINGKVLLLLVAGGSLGTIIRYLIYLLADKHLNHLLPWGTLIVNLTGSLIIGFAWGFMEKSHVPPSVMLFLFIGILGSFTTFSTFAFDNMSLAQSGAYKMMTINILLNNIGGIMLCFGAFHFAKLVLK